METYYLYHGERMLTAVRLPAGASDQQVRQKAIDSEFDFPLGHLSGREAPFEFRNRLHNSQVRTFND